MLSGVKLTTLSSRRSQCGYTIHCGSGKPARRRSAQGLQKGGTRQAADANVPGLPSGQLRNYEEPGFHVRWNIMGIKL